MRNCRHPITIQNCPPDGSTVYAQTLFLLLSFLRLRQFCCVRIIFQVSRAGWTRTQYWWFAFDSECYTQKYYFARWNARYVSLFCFFSLPPCIFGITLRSALISPSIRRGKRETSPSYILYREKPYQCQYHTFRTPPVQLWSETQRSVFCVLFLTSPTSESSSVDVENFNV